MGKSKKKDKSEKINFLRQQYEAFLEEDRKRRERNEYILQRLDLMRSTASSAPTTSPPYHTHVAPSVLKVRTTNIYSEVPKYGMQTFPPQLKGPFLPNETSNIILPNLTKNKMLIPEHITENNIEQTILKEISKKYILIPKLKAQYVIENSINESPNEQPDTDAKTDIEWQSKYDILRKLNSVDNYNNPIIHKDVENEDTDTHPSTKVTCNDGGEKFTYTNYECDNNEKRQHSITKASINIIQNKPSLLANNINVMNNAKDAHITKDNVVENFESAKLIKSNDEINRGNNENLDVCEKYGKDFIQNEKSKMIAERVNDRSYEQLGNSIPVETSSEIESSELYEQPNQDQDSTYYNNIQSQVVYTANNSTYDTVHHYDSPEAKSALPNSYPSTYEKTNSANPTTNAEQGFENQQYSHQIPNTETYTEAPIVNGVQQYEEISSTELYNGQTDLNTGRQIGNPQQLQSEDPVKINQIQSEQGMQPYVQGTQEPYEQQIEQPETKQTYELPTQNTQQYEQPIQIEQAYGQPNENMPPHLQEPMILHGPTHQNIQPYIQETLQTYEQPNQNTQQYEQQNQNIQPYEQPIENMPPHVQETMIPHGQPNQNLQPYTQETLEKYDRQNLQQENFQTNEQDIQPITQPDQNMQPYTQETLQAYEPVHQQMYEQTPQTDLQEPIAENIVHNQEWTDQQNINQTQPVADPDQYAQGVYNQEVTGSYENQLAYPEQQYDQYNYTQVPQGGEQNYNPNQVYDTSQYVDPNQSAELAEHQRQYQQGDVQEYLQNEEQQHVGQYEYEADPDYTQQQYAEYSSQETAQPVGEQQNPGTMQQEETPVYEYNQQLVNNTPTQ